MRDEGLPFEHERIESAYIERCEREKTTLARNPELKGLMRLLMLSNGFGLARPQQRLAELLYVDEDPTHHDPFYEPEIPGHRKKGWNRLQNLLRGHSRITEREAAYLHNALRAGFGDEWADTTTPEMFAMMSPSGFFQHAQRMSLPWPTMNLSPALAFEAMAAGDQGLAIAPAFLETERLGVIAGSRNAELRTEARDPTYAPGDNYVLHVRGLAPGDEQLVVFEIADSPLSFPDQNEDFLGFPISTGLVTAHNATIKPDDAAGYEIAEATGAFAFYALTVPADIDLGPALGVDLEATRWNVDDVAVLARHIRALRLEGADRFRLARHGYHVN